MLPPHPGSVSSRSSTKRAACSLFQNSLRYTRSPSGSASVSGKGPPHAVSGTGAEQNLVSQPSQRARLSSAGANRRSSTARLNGAGSAEKSFPLGSPPASPAAPARHAASSGRNDSASREDSSTFHTESPVKRNSSAPDAKGAPPSAAAAPPFTSRRQTAGGVVPASAAKSSGRARETRALSSRARRGGREGRAGEKYAADIGISFYMFPRKNFSLYLNLRLTFYLPLRRHAARTERQHVSTAGSLSPSCGFAA